MAARSGQFGRNVGNPGGIEVENRDLKNGIGNQKKIYTFIARKEMTNLYY
jgi:hypothetical protein